LPWYHTRFSTSLCSWGSSGSASCCIMPGQTRVPEGIRSHPNLCRRRASVPATRSRFLASPASPSVPPVSRPTSPYPSHPVARHPVSCLRGDGRAKWTPRGISARIRTVPIGAGSGSATAVPMDFLPFVNPHLSIFTPSARLAHDEFGLHHSRCDDAAWLQAYAAVGRQYCVKPGHGAAPLLATSCTHC
jgi:hypothetical protein